LWRVLREVGRVRRAEVERLVESYLGDRRALEAIDKAELLRRLTVGGVTLIDVRPTVEYRQGHIPTARSLPLEELERRLDELPRERTIVAYCRGPYCVLADEALRLLRRGFHAQRLSDGFPEWRAADYPIEVETPAAPAP
jgi:rhodanese-related sulfurtransferase